MTEEKWSLSQRLLLGYALSQDYLKENGNSESYIFGKCINYLAMPYAFHISGGICLFFSSILNLFFHLHGAGSLLFVLSIILMVIISIIATKIFKRRYNLNEFLRLRAVCNNLPKNEQKKLQKNATLFFVLQIIIFFLIEMPLIILL